jgi:hypothetical protein
MALTQEQIEEFRDKAIKWAGSPPSRYDLEAFAQDALRILAPSQPSAELAACEECAGTGFNDRGRVCQCSRSKPPHQPTERRENAHFAQQERQAVAAVERDLKVASAANQELIREISNVDANMREAVEQAVRKCCEYRDEDINTFTAGWNDCKWSDDKACIEGIKAVLDAHLAAALPAEKKTPEERVTIDHLSLGEFPGDAYIVKVDGMPGFDGHTFFGNITGKKHAEIYRLGLIAQIAAQGGDHA